MSFTGVSNLDYGIDMAITSAEAEKLRSIRSGVANVLSVYLPVPSDPAELPGLPALTRDLIDAAVTASGPGSRNKPGRRYR
jgi:hypothetical protein